MKLILKCTSNDPDYTGQAEYTFLNLTPQLAKHLLEKLDIFAATKAKYPEHEVYELVCWDSPVIMFGVGDQSAEELPEPLSSLAAQADNEEVVEVPDNLVVPPDFVAVMECPQTIVSEDIKFFGYPRHTSVQITTAGLSRELLIKAIS